MKELKRFKNEHEAFQYIHKTILEKYFGDYASNIIQYVLCIDLLSACYFFIMEKKDVAKEKQTWETIQKIITIQHDDNNRSYIEAMFEYDKTINPEHSGHYYYSCFQSEYEEEKRKAEEKCLIMLDLFLKAETGE